MNTNDFFLNAIRGTAHWKRGWVIRAFAITTEPLSASAEALTPWSILRTPAGVNFVDSTGSLQVIDDARTDTPLLTAKTVLTVPAGFFEHWPEGGTTTAGNLLYNASCLWPTVGAKFGYINERVNQKNIEKLFAAKMVDDPKDPAQRDPSQVYVSDWLRYGQAIKYMEEFTQIFVWSLSAQSVVPSKAVLQRKQELLTQHAADIGNPVVQAKIFKELEDLDAKLLANDPGAAFITTPKHKLARRKLTIMYGSEQGLDAGAAPKLITQSLHDGLKPENMVDVMNVSRAGSFDRGAETMLGGVEAKWGDRIMSAAKMSEDDCGTTLGYTYTVRPMDVDNTTGRYLMDAQGLRLVETTEQAKALVGQRITVRTPARCKAGPSVVWCKYCLGSKLSSNPQSLALAVSAYGSGFLQLFLQSMHAKAAVPVRLKVRELMS